MKILFSILSIILLFAIVFLVPIAFGYNETEQEEVIAMFESFEKKQDVILLTCFELVIDDMHYDRSEILYNGNQCNIVSLDEDGFYSYTYNEETLTVEFLFTRYEDFETTMLGTTVLIGRLVNDFFGDDCFWFRISDSRTEESDQVYFAWNVETKQGEIVDDVLEEYEYSIDNNRTENYTFVRDNRILFPGYIDVTDNETGVTKRIDRNVLNKFEEGTKIKQINKMTVFDVDHVFVKDGTIYFISYFEVGFLGSPCYYYVVKWDFETEECEYYTALFFEEDQEWIDDMYIK